MSTRFIAQYGNIGARTSLRIIPVNGTASVDVSTPPDFDAEHVDWIVRVLEDYEAQIATLRKRVHALDNSLIGMDFAHVERRMLGSMRVDGTTTGRFPAK